MEVKNQPIAKAELLIRKPVAEVFEAFVDPDIITKFWFDKSTGRLECEKTVQWHWELCNAFTEVRVKALEENKRILIEWGSDNPTTVEWILRLDQMTQLMSASLTKASLETAMKSWIKHSIRRVVLRLCLRQRKRTSNTALS